MKIGILQQHNTADVADNKTRLAQGIIDLAHRGAELIVLQELHNSLYFCQIESVVTTIEATEAVVCSGESCLYLCLSLII